MKKLVIFCCLAALLAACRTTTDKQTNTENINAEQTKTAQTETTNDKTENIYTVRGCGSHYTVNGETYNEFCCEINGLVEIFGIYDDITTNTDYIIYLSDNATPDNITDDYITDYEEA